MAKSGEFAEFVAEYVIKQESEDIDEKEMQILAKLKQTVKPLIEKQLSVRSNDSDVMPKNLSRDVSTSDSIKANTSKKATEEEVSNESENKRLTERQESSESDSEECTVRKRKPEPRSVSTGDNEANSEPNNSKDKSQEKLQKTSGKLMSDEKTESGSVRFNVYKKYFQLMGVGTVTAVLLAYVCSSAATAVSGLWLCEWSEDSLSGGDQQPGLRYERLGVYAAVGLLEMVSLFGAQAWLRLGCVTAAKKLHNQMLDRVVRAPMSYFDTTPIGRLLNHFARDVMDIDTDMIFAMDTIVLQLLRLVVLIGTIGYELPHTLPLIAVVLAVYVGYQRVYTASSRQLKRIASAAGAPIIGHFSESNNGTDSIRAYGAGDRFVTDFHRLSDNRNRCHYGSVLADCWIGIRLNFLGHCLVLLMAVFAVLFRADLSPGMTALLITYTLDITVALNGFIREVSQTEVAIVAVERCLELMDIPIEAEWYNEKTKPAADWPTMGCIQFTDYCTKYREGLDLVLKDIAIDMKGRQR
ncbi:unnamed protein product, partial [Medioppia subpectinata]